MSTLATDVQSGDGSTTVFTLAFEFLSRDDVHVSRLASTDPDTAEGTALAVIETGTPTGDQYAWTSDTQIQLGTAPTSDQKVKFQRVTPIDSQVVEWNDGSFLIAEDLNDSDLQSLYLIQELSDRVETDENAAVGEAPDDGVLYGRQSKAWQPVPDPDVGEAPDDGALYGRQSKSWQVVPDPGVEEAPIDSKEYVRVNQSWKEIPDDQTGVPEAPINQKVFARSNAAWIEINDTGGITYKGTRDLTLAAPAAVAGDFYVNTATTGVAADSWTGIAGDALEGAERVIYNGSTWEILPMPPTPAPTGVVEEVVAGNNIIVNSGNPAEPVVSVKDGVFLESFEVKAGTNITVVNGDTVSVTNNSFLPYDISTLAPLPTP